MLITFINSYHQGIQQIDEKVGANEYLDVAEVAHKICSPCRHLGADKLWSLTKKLENECKNNIPNGNISKLVLDLKYEFNEIEKQINMKLKHINP
jgi:HPt (histidine-containing phosphotransfer) domain-containing protein